MIHRYWAGPTNHYDWAGSVLDNAHPGHTVHMWAPNNLPGELTATIAQLEQPDRRQKSNVARCWLLHHFGGLWVDHDLIPLARLDREPEPWTAAIETPAGPIRESCALWFPEPGHPMMAEALTRITADHRQMLAHVLRALEPQYTDGVGLEPRVNPYDAAGRPLLAPHIRPLAVHTWASSRRTP